ncbi:MAG: hypothetical protein R2932_48465 [Caldilineaceae bacterium]
MSIHITNELTIEIGDLEHSLTLWLVSYDDSSKETDADIRSRFIEALQVLCLRRGWVLECGDDPYQEKSLGVFTGFARPDDPRRLAEGGRRK